MSRKAKFGRSIGFLLRRLLVSLAAGALFLFIGGLIAAVAVSVSQRYRTAEDTVSHYLRIFEPSWHNNPEFAPEITDIEITRQHTVDELNAAHITFSWQMDSNYRSSICSGDLLAQEYSDLFGGWRILGHLAFFCGEFGASNSISHTFWESLPWEIPHRYYFYAAGTHHKAAQVEAVLADGGSERVDIVEKRFALVIQRDAPFHFDKLVFYDAKGKVAGSRNIRH